MRALPPPTPFTEFGSPIFAPAEDMPEWVETTFLCRPHRSTTPSTPIWRTPRSVSSTVVENSRKRRRIIATVKRGSHAPKFSRSTGRPVFTIRGHNVEEFVGRGQMLPVSARSPTRAPRSPACTSPTLAAPAGLRLREGHSAFALAA